MTSSRGERDLREALHTLVPHSTIVANDRSVLDGLELDAWLPEQRVGVEFNGIYWHSDVHNTDKSHTRHRDKYLLARDRGIRLVQVWEDDWMQRREIVLDQLAFTLGVPAARKIGARACQVVSLSASQARTFLGATHIQGYAAGGVRLGLRDAHGSVVAVIVGKQRNPRDLEIIRYSTSLGTEVVGGFSRLLTHAIKVAGPHTQHVLTFSDHVISAGKLYRRLGFAADKEIRPDYSYVVGTERIHKFNFRKARFRDDPALKYDPAMSESQLAELNNIRRIWDAGKTRWRLDL